MRYKFPPLPPSRGLSHVVQRKRKKVRIRPNTCRGTLYWHLTHNWSVKTNCAKPKEVKQEIDQGNLVTAFELLRH